MLIVAPNKPKQVVAWRWPFSRESEFEAAAKRLSKEKLGKLRFLVDQFSNAILLGEFTRAIPDAKTLDRAVERFEVLANPIVSAAMSMEDELANRGINVSYRTKDPMTGNEARIDELYMSLFNLVKMAKAWWGDEEKRRGILSAMVARMTSIQDTLERVSEPYASPRAIKEIDKIPYREDSDWGEKMRDKVETAPPEAKPETPAPAPEPEAPSPAGDVPYFAGTGDEEKKGHQAKSRTQLRDDVLDALRANRDKLPDDLKAGFPGLVRFFMMMSKVKTAGFLENVYNQRKGDVSRLLQRFYGDDYARVKDFEQAVLSWLEHVWNVEDFPEVDPQSHGIEPFDHLMDVAREMTDRGDSHEAVVDEISRLMMKITGGREFKLNDLVNKRPHFFSSNPEFAEAVEKTRKEIRGTLSAPAAPAIPSQIPKATPKAPIVLEPPEEEVGVPEEYTGPMPPEPAPPPRKPSVEVLKPGETPKADTPRFFKPPRKPTRKQRT